MQARWRTTGVRSQSGRAQFGQQEPEAGEQGQHLPELPSLRVGVDCQPMALIGCAVGERAFCGAVDSSPRRRLLGPRRLVTRPRDGRFDWLPLGRDPLHLHFLRQSKFKLEEDGQ